MKTKKSICSTSGCTGEVGERSITGLCKRCYSAIYAWGGRSKQDALKRAKDLRLYESRINHFLPDKEIRLYADEVYKPLTVMPGKVKQYRKRTQYKIVKKSK